MPGHPENGDQERHVSKIQTANAFLLMVYMARELLLLMGHRNELGVGKWELGVRS
jgi:hypothetical protein